MTAYTYTLAGAIDSETYPSGRVVKNVLDASGDLWKAESARGGSPHGVSASCSDQQGFWSYAGHFSSNGGPGGSGPGGDRHNSGTYNAAGNGCFTGDTQVMLADGTKVPINQLRQGNVLRTGTDYRETAEIREVYERESSDVRLLRLPGKSGGTSDLRVTGEHMVWKDGAGWTAARNLESGDWLHDHKGEMIEIVSVQPLPGRHQVFTVQLKGNNSFYAGRRARAGLVRRALPGRCCSAQP